MLILDLWDIAVGSISIVVTIACAIVCWCVWGEESPDEPSR